MLSRHQRTTRHVLQRPARAPDTQHGVCQHFDYVFNVSVHGIPVADPTHHLRKAAAKLIGSTPTYTVRSLVEKIMPMVWTNRLWMCVRPPPGWWSTCCFQVRDLTHDFSERATASLRATTYINCILIRSTLPKCTTV